MKSIGVRWLFAAAMLSAAPELVAAQDAARGAALLAEARRALGGEDRLRGIKTLDVRGDFKRSAGRMMLEGELQIRLEVPDKLRRDEDFSLPGGRPPVTRTEVLNGSTVWENTSGGGGTFAGRFGRGDQGVIGSGRGGRPPLDTAEIEDAQRRARQTDLSRFMLAWLLTTAGDAVWIAAAESPGGKADVIEISSSNGPSTRLFLDQVTHMPLMMTWQDMAPPLMPMARRSAPGVARGDGAGRGDQATQQMTLSDYRAVNGMLLPHLITRGVNDMTTEEWTIDSYRLDTSFKPDVFSK